MGPAVSRPPLRTALRAALVVVGLLLALHAGRLALLAPNAHTDNLYNVGMVRHSAASSWWPLLQTSFVHWFFEPYPVERAEDWHRGGSLVLVAALARVLGSDSELVLRLPHLAWLMTLWWVAWRLSLAAAPPRETRERRVELAVLALALLVVLSPGPQVLTGAFMDDVPATVMVCAALLVLVRPGALSTAAAGATGAAVALGFWMKDLALIWGILVPAWIGLSSLLAPPPGRLRRSLKLSAVCLAVFLLVAAVKVGWNLSDLGQLLPRPARLGMVARNVPGVVDGEHHVWFLDREHRVAEGRLLSATVAALDRRVTLGARLTGYAVADLAPWWVLGGIGLLVLRRTPAGGSALRLAGLGALAAAAVAGLGGVHLLEPLQLRYWLVAVVAACALGCAGLAALWRAPLGRWGKGALAAAAVIAVAPGVAGHRSAVVELGRLGGYTAPAVRAAQAVGPGPLMLELVRGAGLWAERPELGVVAVRAAPMAALDPAAMRGFLTHYPVAAALVDLEQEPDLVRVLLARGFTARERVGSELVLEPPRPGPL